MSLSVSVSATAASDDVAGVADAVGVVTFCGTPGADRTGGLPGIGGTGRGGLAGIGGGAFVLAEAAGDATVGLTAVAVASPCAGPVVLESSDVSSCGDLGTVPLGGTTGRRPGNTRPGDTATGVGFSSIDGGGDGDAGMVTAETSDGAATRPAERIGVGAVARADDADCPGNGGQTRCLLPPGYILGIFFHPGTRGSSRMNLNRPSISSNLTSVGYEVAAAAACAAYGVLADPRRS